MFGGWAVAEGHTFSVLHLVSNYSLRFDIATPCAVPPSLFIQE